MPRTAAWLEAPLLDERCPLPLTEPFTREAAQRLGVSRWQFRLLVESGLVRQLVRGVYVAAQARDSLALRARALSLVVPESAIVTDVTAAWLHGVDLLPPSALGAMPPVQVFGRTGSRVRRDGVATGTRRMLDEDVGVVDGVLVTTKLRTALDLGRSLRRPWALAAMDGLVRAGADREALLGGVARFRGERGVVQLRELAPLTDARSESPAESALRMHWLDAGLPTPELQIWVFDGGLARFRVDMGIPDLRYGAEYDGKAFHGSDQVQRDEERRTWLDREGDWLIDVFVSHDLFGRDVNPGARLRQGIVRARQRRGLWVPEGRYLR